MLGPDRVYDGIAGSLDGQSTRWLVGRFGSGSCLVFLSTQPFSTEMVIKATTSAPIITALALAVGDPMSGGISVEVVELMSGRYCEWEDICSHLQMLKWEEAL